MSNSELDLAEKFLANMAALDNEIKVFTAEFLKKNKKIENRINKIMSNVTVARQIEMIFSEHDKQAELFREHCEHYERLQKQEQALKEEFAERISSSQP